MGHMLVLQGHVECKSAIFEQPAIIGRRGHFHLVLHCRQLGPAFEQSLDLVRWQLFGLLVCVDATQVPAPCAWGRRLECTRKGRDQL